MIVYVGNCRPFGTTASYGCGGNGLHHRHSPAMLRIASAAGRQFYHDKLTLSYHMGTRCPIVFGMTRRGLVALYCDPWGLVACCVTRRGLVSFSSPTGKKIMVSFPSSRERARLHWSLAFYCSSPRRNAGKQKESTPIGVDSFCFLVTRRGLEPRTHCLKGSCSTG